MVKLPKVNGYNYERPVPDYHASKNPVMLGRWFLPWKWIVGNLAWDKHGSPRWDGWYAFTPAGRYHAVWEWQADNIHKEGGRVRIVRVEWVSPILDRGTCQGFADKTDGDKLRAADKHGQTLNDPLWVLGRVGTLMESADRGAPDVAV